MPDLFERLKASCPEDWEAYTRHPFVLGMADGTLPEPAFRYYLEQDYLFLIQFARAYALAGYKARTLEDLKRAKDGIAAIMDVELNLHVDFCRKWGIDPASLEDLPEDPANMAYTRYVLERGMAGNLLDLHVALLPCMLGYGEIGPALDEAAKARGGETPYAGWIAMYSGPDYQAACADERRYIDRLAGDDLPDARFDELAQTFRDATRLEIKFWQMGLDAV
ncbi:MAG: thiaminase II [Alphaproteobacteria bacterium]|jgi:thiaminase/transcriptional activator TenA|uniref:thiaminase II n=1 Tax=Pacificispira sp. TaxID=2888761 RepID=UPI001B2A93AD|nr:thiaminase II [Alphaproteobacteria bacterium]MBO6864264.1 thiaminase II [Alphaproteobacteria bacterium]